MYFHPLILTEAQKQQRLAACQDFARLWLDGIDRQYRLHADAVHEFCARQQENLRALSEAIDIADSVVRCSAWAAPASLELLQVSPRYGETAAEVQCQAAMLADRRAKELSGSMFPMRMSEGASAALALSDQRKSRRRQMMA